MSFRTNSRGNVYPVDSKNILKFDPKTKRFNMFSNGNNESDNQKRKHLERFANITKKGIFGASNKIKETHQVTQEAIKLKNQERAGQKEANHKEVNLRISGIMGSGEPPYMMIQNLQRLLNEKSKDMDKPMLQTVQNELTKLHKINGTSQNDSNQVSDKTNDSEKSTQRSLNPYRSSMRNNRNDDDDDDSKQMTPDEVFSQGL